MKTYFFTFLITCGLFLSSCIKNGGVRPQCKMSCQEGLPCTFEFRSVVVNVVNTSGEGIVLDDFKVIRKSDGKIILRNKGTDIPAPGRYVLFSDAQREETSRCGEEFIAQGYKNNKLVCNSVYNIAHNCCHIYLLSGDTKIVVAE